MTRKICHHCSLRAGANALFLLLWLAVFGALPAAAQEVTGARIEHADKEPQNWLTFFGNYRAWSYSELNQITRENAQRLVPAWAFSTGDPSGLESAPLVADGVLYLVDQDDDVFAIDAATGKTLWTHIYKWKKKSPPRPGRTRGLAMGYGMLYIGTADNHVYAIDAKTGQEAWDTEVEDLWECGCRITSAPLVVKDKVIAGVTGGDQAHRGYLNAFDAKTGKPLWRFYVIPAPGEPGSETWPGDSWKLGGGSTWYTGSYDPELNLIYWGVGNPSSDYYGNDRQGSNLYTDSLIALDADTGKLKWYFQETPHDLYDYDSDPEPVLIDVKEKGHTRKLVVHSSKNGYAYVLDRETGKFIRAFPYAEKITWTKGLDKEGKPIDAVVPEDGKDYLFCPGSEGGRNRNHSAYSPQTGWWYNTSLEDCSHITPKKEEVDPGYFWYAGAAPNALPPDADPNISAFDPLTGEKQWTYHTKYFNISSLLATAGDLIFGGDVLGGTFALDARTGKKLWSFNTGGSIESPPVSYSVNGRQYIAISVGNGAAADRFIPQLWPELKTQLPQKTATLFVFALPEDKR